MHLQKVIEQFGYTPKQAAVYLVLLNLGEATISEIVKMSNLPRTSLYSILSLLNKNGLANYYKMRGRKYWVAGDPKKLLINLKEKEAALQEVISELQAMRHEVGAKPSVKFFKGIDGIKAILDDIIESKRTILAMTSIEDAVTLLGETFKDFIEKRQRHHLRVRFLTNRSPETLVLKKRDSKELRQTKFLPKNSFVKNANFIYGNKIAILSLNKKHPIGIIIEEADIAETQTMLFEAIWSQSTY